MPTNLMDSYGAALNNAANLQKMHGGTNHKEDKMLDIHRLDNLEYIFGIDDLMLSHLEVIFTRFVRISGINIDPYADTILDVGCMKNLVRAIDIYVGVTDLNKNKQETSKILEFKGMLNLFIQQGIAIKLVGD